MAKQMPAARPAKQMLAPREKCATPDENYQKEKTTGMKVHNKNKGEGGFLKGCLATIFCCWLCDGSS
ncbi:hypothetical protein ACOSP7_018830 [Xanthoceras sorbifolium]